MSSVSFAAHIRVGSHRLSRVSVSKKTTSCASTSCSRARTSDKTSSRSASLTGCPGMGMAMRCPADATPGKIRRRCSAAAAAFGAPPSRQSANSKSDCRTGLLNDTTPESTKVMFRTPHARRHRATAHPSVPAPSSRHLVFANPSRSSSGRSRQRMSLRFRSTACDARRSGSMLAPRSTARGPARPRGLSSQPTAPGHGAFSPSASGERRGRRRTSSRDASAETRPEDRRARMTRIASTRHRCAASVARFRSAHPGCS